MLDVKTLMGRTLMNVRGTIPLLAALPFQTPLGGITLADSLWEARGAPNLVIY